MPRIAAHPTLPLLLCSLFAGGLIISSLAGCESSSESSKENTAPDGSMDAGESGPFSWTLLPAVGDGPIQEIAVTHIDNVVYVIGGFTLSLMSVPTVQRFDLNTQTWTKAADLPIAVHHANAIGFDGKLYVLGALTDLSFTAIGESFVYDPSNDQWTALAPMPAGSERGAGIVGIIDGQLCVAGGFRTNIAVADFSCYDPRADTWNISLPSLPQTTDHLAGGVVDNIFYVIGGRSRTIDSIRNTTYAYLPTSGEWQQRAPMPTSRGGHAAGIVQGKFIVVGGEGNSAEASGVFPEVERYDPSTDRWQPLGVMRTPRHGMGAVGIGDSLYVPGGATQRAFAAVDTFESFFISP